MKMLVKYFSVGVTALLLSACSSGGMGNNISTNNTEAAKTNFDLGLAYVQQGQLDAAQTKFAKAITFDENYHAAYNALGAIYEEKGAYALAIKAYSRAAANKEYYLARLNYARVLCSNPPQGVTSIKQALAIYKDIEVKATGDNKAAALTGSGVCFARAKQYPAAEMSFNQALATTAAFPPALLELARVQHLQGKAVEAKQTLQTYVSIAGVNASAKQLGAQLGLSL